MPTPMRKSIKKITWHAQRGVSLFIVLVILLLSLIVVLGGLAVSNLNEALVGNQSDAQRAYGAAQALLEAAQRDIRLNGRYCEAALGQEGINSQVEGAPVKCTLRYPSDSRRNDYSDLAILIGLNNCGTGKYAGVCISGNPTNPQFQTSQFTNDKNGLLKNAADYTTGAPAGSADYGGTGRVGGGESATSLALGTGKNSRGKYWVEIFQYNSENSQKINGPVPDGTYPFIFRITVRVQGLRRDTVSVLRTYYIAYPKTISA